VLLNIFRVVVLLTITFESQAEYGRQQTGVNSVVISGTFFRDFMGLLYHGIGLKVFYGKDKFKLRCYKIMVRDFFQERRRSACTILEEVSRLVQHRWRRVTG
jgi:hypothetical protein